MGQITNRAVTYIHIVGIGKKLYGFHSYVYRRLGLIYGPSGCSYNIIYIYIYYSTYQNRGFLASFLLLYMRSCIYGALHGAHVIMCELVCERSIMWNMPDLN